jgi:NAD(P)-dependent dehydrogenase (short-subunit alcohol dehydrogenase family)
MGSPCIFKSILLEESKMDLIGKKAIVTGGRRGIGRAIVEVFAQRGAEVLIADRNMEECTAVAQEI